jgi:hypothetical protein
VNNIFWICCEVRARPRYDYRGYGWEIDWSRKAKIRRYDLPKWFIDHERQAVNTGKEKAAARNKGLRHIVEVGDYFYALTSGGVLELDKETMVVNRRFSHNLQLGGHYLVPYQGGFLHNVCIFDSIVHMDMDGNRMGIWKITRDRNQADALNVNTVDHDLTRDIRQLPPAGLIKYKEWGVKYDQLHMNTITVIDNSEVYVFSGSKGILFKMVPDFEVILKDRERLKGAHDVQIFNDKILANNSHRSEFNIYDLKSGTLEKVIDIPKRGVAIKRMSDPGFLRGLAKIDNDRVLIGTAPLGVFEIDVRRGEIVDEMQFAKDEEVYHTCHGINARVRI